MAITGYGERLLQSLAASGRISGASRPAGVRRWSFDLAALRKWLKSGEPKWPRKETVSQGPAKERESQPATKEPVLRRASKKRAPKHTYWRGAVLWGRTMLAGHEYRCSLRTGDVALARQRVEEWRQNLIGERFFGEQGHKHTKGFQKWSKPTSGRAVVVRSSAADSRSRDNMMARYEEAMARLRGKGSKTANKTHSGS